MRKGELLESDNQELANGDLPAWMRFVYRIGIISAIVLYLVYWGTQTLSQSLSGISNNLSLHMSETTFYMRQICVNTAKDDVARAGCYPSK